MKIAIVADVHFRGKKLDEKNKAWKEALHKMTDEGVKMMILAGDTFDTRNIGSREASTGAIVSALLEPIPTSLQVVAIKGNGVHEGVNGVHKSPLEVFAGSNIKAVQDLDIISLSDAEIYLVPWLECEDRNARLESFLAKARASKAPYKMIVGHLTVQGCILSSGSSMQMGGEFEVKPELLDRSADLIALGHIHKRQQIGERIHYVGALTQDSFGDEGNAQGFMIVDIQKRSHYFVNVDAPKYRTLDNTRDFEKAYTTDDHFKIRLKEKTDNYDELISLQNVSVEIVPDKDIVTREIEGIDAGRSDEDLLRAWLKEKDHTADDIERIVNEARRLEDYAAADAAKQSMQNKDIGIGGVK